MAHPLHTGWFTPLALVNHHVPVVLGESTCRKWGESTKGVCLLLQYLLQSCSRVCGGEQWRTCVCVSERAGEGYRVREGGEEEGERERERARKVRLHYSLGYSG